MTEPVTNDEPAGADGAEDETDASPAEESIASEATDDPEATGRGANGLADDDEADSEDADQLQREFDTLNDRHLRLVAEFNNFRRRSEQERLGAWARAQADLVGKFLDVVDDLQRVAELDLSNATVETIMEGIDLVDRKVLRVLEDVGVDLLDPTGEPFDPELMEAMMRVPAATDDQVDTVAQVFQKGYQLKGILVRPARVSVYTQG